MLRFAIAEVVEPSNRFASEHKFPTKLDRAAGASSSQQHGRRSALGLFNSVETRRCLTGR
jgi:hypothetical protein